jgi:hypothetical protein
MRSPTLLLPLALAALAAGTIAACGSVGDAASDAATGKDGAPAADAARADAAANDAAVTPACNASDVQLMACYAFEPASPPTQLTDGSSHANHGAISGLIYGSGHRGMAGHFDTGTRITVAKSASFDLDELSLEGWIAPTGLPPSGGRFVIIDVDGQYALQLTDANHVKCATRLADDSLLETATTVPVELDRWTHVACTYAKATGTMTIYIDGAPVQVGQAAVPGPVKTAAASSSVVVGANAPCTPAPCVDTFRGAMDDLRVWARPLTRAEICSLAGRSGC